MSDQCVWLDWKDGQLGSRGSVFGERVHHRYSAVLRRVYVCTGCISYFAIFELKFIERFSCCFVRNNEVTQLRSNTLELW